MTRVNIHRENGNTIVVEALLNDPEGVNRLTRGDTATLRVFETEERFIVLEDATVTAGETKTATATVIDEGATLTVDGTLETGRLAIPDGTLDNNSTVTITGETGGMDLLTYADRAGGFATPETLDSTVTFREFLPEGGGVTSLLVGVEPDNSLQEQDIPGIWGLVESVRDTRRPALNRDEIEAQIRVLARYGEYTDHAAVRDDLEV